MYEIVISHTYPICLTNSFQRKLILLFIEIVCYLDDVELTFCDAAVHVSSRKVPLLPEEIQLAPMLLDESLVGF